MYDYFLIGISFCFFSFCLAVGQESMDNCIFYVHFRGLFGLFNMLIGVVEPQLATNLWLVYALSLCLGAFLLDCSWVTTLAPEVGSRLQLSVQNSRIALQTSWTTSHKILSLGLNPGNNCREPGSLLSTPASVGCTLCPQDSSTVRSRPSPAEARFISKAKHPLLLHFSSDHQSAPRTSLSPTIVYIYKGA